MLKTDEQIKDVKDALRLDLFSQLSGVGVLNPDCGSCLWHKVEFQTFLLSRPLVIHIEIKADVAVTESLFAYANRLFQFYFFLMPLNYNKNVFSPNNYKKIDK